MLLRPYQFELKAAVKSEWAHGAPNVLMRLDTGGGKTVLLASLVQEHQGASAVIAHRQELVGQLSLTLARHGVRHNIIASAKVRKAIAIQHIIELGQSFFDPGSRCAVASVDTLIRAEGLEAWFSQVTLWIVDEAHHVVIDNKWHSCLEKFTHPACVGLGPTATPKRADGKGLGAHADGVFHSMVEGPPMRWLIDEGFLTDYDIVCPESDLQLLEDVSASGDWSTKQLKEAAERSHIVGDVVESYLKWGRGKLGLTFATDVDTAEKMTQAFRAAGVRAETLTGKTEDGFRRQMLKLYAARQIDQLVTVDIVAEGFDLPAIEVESKARPTQSLGLYMQQFGRSLRPIYSTAYAFDMSTRQGRRDAIAASSKPKALIIDHVANTIRHQGPPDKPRVWTLDRRDKKGGGGSGIPMRVCGAGHNSASKAQIGRPPCYQPFEKFYDECPYCAYPLPEPQPMERTSPAAVDGDLALLDAATLARLRGEVGEVDQTLDEYRAWLTQRGATQVMYLTNSKRHVEKQDAQTVLRTAMADFGGRRRADGLTDRQMQKLFFLTYGVDVMSAQALGKQEALELAERIWRHG